MKTKLLFILFTIGFFNLSNAQISMIGTALPNELNMAQFNLYEFQQQATFINGNIKFRQGNSWDVNWGSNAFPSGTGVQNGADIPVTAGTYIVSFNSSSGSYNFVPTTPTPIISIVGTGVNGWPEDQTTPEITLSTIDGISYTINNLVVTNGLVKFRKNLSWDVNWGDSTFPIGTGILNGPNIPTIAGTYDVTLNISNATYTFIPSPNVFPSIGIWGPSVDSQNGYAGPDVDMTTTDGIIYTLSGFYFSGGQAYFRQDNASTLVWGSTNYPTGTAVLSGPSLFIPGGEHFVTFNRITGEYSFTFPSVGILGTAFNGFEVADTDLNTTDGFSYTIDDLALSVGEVKFRKDNSWATNWGNNAFPMGTGVQDGVNIPITNAGNYSILFDRLSGDYMFMQLLGTDNFKKDSVLVYPNPTENIWNITSSREKIISFELYDSTGKLIKKISVDDFTFSIVGSALSNGLYLGKINTSLTSKLIKLIKK
jgi:starch-binding outer membrane protein SusE/F